MTSVIRRILQDSIRILIPKVTIIANNGNINRTKANRVRTIIMTMNTSIKNIPRSECTTHTTVTTETTGRSNR